jgi:hypothetical protein
MGWPPSRVVGPVTDAKTGHTLVAAGDLRAVLNGANLFLRAVSARDYGDDLAAC